MAECILIGSGGGSGSGSTSTIVVVTDEPTLYGRPVTVTAGTKTFTGMFSNTGECTFSNLAIYGAVQAESTNSEGVSAKGSTNITYFGTYVVGISFNVATINLTCSDVSFAGVPVSIYYNGEVVAETSLRLNGQGVLEGTVYVENPGRYTAVAVSAGKTVFTSVAVITLKQTYTGALAASYLPNSDIEHIICEAYGDNFVEGALTWGNGQTPVTFNLNGSSVAPTLQEDNSVYIPVATNNIFASVDLGAPATPFTAYVVMKLRNPNTESRMIFAMNSRSNDQGIALYGNTVIISSWNNGTSTGISSSQYIVGAIQFVGTYLGRGFVRGYGYAEKPSATAGQYVTLARPDINPSTGNASPGDGYFKYVAVVNEAESIETVQANIEHLNSIFLEE